VSIYQDFVLAVDAVSNRYDELILICAPPSDEVLAAALERRRDDVGLRQLLEAFVNSGAPREGIQKRPGVLVLRVYPRAGFRALLIFEPTIWIGDRGAVDRLGHLLNLCRRRRLALPCRYGRG